MASEDHKRRVMRVQAVLTDYRRQALNAADARMLLEDAGVSPDGTTHMLDRHQPRSILKTVGEKHPA